MIGTIDVSGTQNVLDFGTTGYFRGTTTSGNKFDFMGLVGSTKFVVGGTYPELELKGKGTRPTYNSKELALYSDIPTGSGEYVITGQYELVSEDPETYNAQLDTGYDYEAIAAAIEEGKGARCVLSDKSSNKQIFLSLESYEKAEEFISFVCVDEEHYIWTLVATLGDTALTNATVLKATTGGYYIPSIQQTDDSHVTFSFTPTQEGMESVQNAIINLPRGPKGD